MKLNSKQLLKVIEGLKDRPDELKQTLQYIFSFEYNIDIFSLFFFEDTVTNTIPKFHKELYDILFRNSNDALAAPRGHGKSSVTGLIFLMFCIVNKREKYIVYVSQNHTKTVQFLAPIRHEFKNNPNIKFVYGELKVLNEKDKEGKDREDCFDVNGSRIEAVSFEKNLRGFKFNNIRPTLIICDDIEDDMRVLNPELRAKDSHKLNKIIIPSLDINGRLKMIGTILHLDSLLLNKIKLWNGKIFSACDENFQNILWPERFTRNKLEEIKHSIGSLAFQQEYMNNPTDNESNVIKREWVISCFRSDLSGREARQQQYTTKVLGVDFAFSDRVTADKSAFCSLGKKDDLYFILDCTTKKGLSILEQMDYIKHVLHSSFNYNYIGLEENSIKAISKNIYQYGLPVTLFWTGSSDPAETKKGYDFEYYGRRHTVGKNNLIMRLGVAFENKKLVIPYKTEEDKHIAHEILSECTSFALADGKLVEGGVHPDIPIALGYALELLQAQNEPALVF